MLERNVHEDLDDSCSVDKLYKKFESMGENGKFEVIIYDKMTPEEFSHFPSVRSSHIGNIYLSNGDQLVRAKEKNVEKEFLLYDFNQSIVDRNFNPSSLIVGGREYVLSKSKVPLYTPFMTFSDKPKISQEHEIVEEKLSMHSSPASFHYDMVNHVYEGKVKTFCEWLLNYENIIEELMVLIIDDCLKQSLEFFDINMLFPKYIDNGEEFCHVRTEKKGLIYQGKKNQAEVFVPFDDIPSSVIGVMKNMRELVKNYNLSEEHKKNLGKNTKGVKLDLIWGMLFEAIIAYQKFGQNVVFHESGPDMKKYAAKYSKALTWLFQALKRSDTNLKIPDKFVYVVVPIFDNRLLSTDENITRSIIELLENEKTIKKMDFLKEENNKTGGEMNDRIKLAKVNNVPNDFLSKNNRKKTRNIRESMISELSNCFAGPYLSGKIAKTKNFETQYDLIDVDKHYVYNDAVGNTKYNVLASLIKEVHRVHVKNKINDLKNKKNSGS